MKHPKEYRNQEVVVLGLARSGVAVAQLFHEYGAKVTINDKKERTLCPEAEPLADLGISVICGSHPEGLIHPGVSLLVKNPGIPYRIDPIVQADRLGIETVTEVEVAYHICEAPILAVTGSNGKTTTTTWIGKMLDEGGLKPIVAGNIGRPLCDAAREAEADNRMVVELSSFQLKGTARFRPAVACLLNVYETHLDYHGTMEDYIASKAKLFANQTTEDTAVINWDDPVCRKLTDGHIKAQLLPFSMKEQLPHGVFLRKITEGNVDVETVVYVDRDGQVTPIVATSAIGVPGRHNVENALAATAVAIAAGVSTQAIAKALQQFRGVEHRLEFVRERNKVSYYNGSKATNPAATIKDIEAFSQPIVLIAGGLDRGMEYDDLLPYLKHQVKAVVALGETKHKIARVAQESGIRNVKLVDTASNAAEALEQAVRGAAAFAEAGDVVLLSPACASWDMFTSYEERGRMFKQSVHNL